MTDSEKLAAALAAVRQLRGRLQDDWDFLSRIEALVRDERARILALLDATDAVAHW